MTELSQEILERWQVRHTKKQKEAFIAFLRERFPGLSIEEQGLLHSKNLVLGDVDHAQVVFSAHYDTCSTMPFPNFLTPKNIPVYVLFNLAIAAVMLLLVFGVSRLTAALFHSFWISYFAGLATCAACIFLLLGGKDNPHTANDNTSGVISLCEIYQALPEDLRVKAAFVFFDNEEIGMIGSQGFLKRHKPAMREKLLFNLDCVSDGEVFLLIENKAARREWGAALEVAFAGEGFLPEGKRVQAVKSSNTLYPSDQLGFPCYAALAAFREKKFWGLYMTRIHTKRDTVFQEENIGYIRESALRLIGSLSE